MDLPRQNRFFNDVLRFALLDKSYPRNFQAQENEIWRASYLIDQLAKNQSAPLAGFMSAAWSKRKRKSIFLSESEWCCQTRNTLLYVIFDSTLAWFGLLLWALPSPGLTTSSLFARISLALSFDYSNNHGHFNFQQSLNHLRILFLHFKSMCTVFSKRGLERFPPMRITLILSRLRCFTFALLQ